MPESENEVEEVPAKMRDAVREFADLVARVHYQGVRVVLMKNGKPWAFITKIPKEWMDRWEKLHPKKKKKSKFPR